MKYLCLLFVITCFFRSPAQSIDALLVKYFEQAKEFPNDTVFQRKFFDTFPDNFALFNSIYGYDKNAGILNVLYDVSHEHITFFCRLYEIIPKTDFFKRIIDVSLGGYWDADAINSLQMCIQNLFLENTKEAVEVLSTYNDADIKSFWHFFFDSRIFDHPLNVARYNQMRARVKAIDLRVFELMKEQWNYDYAKYLKINNQQ